MGDGVPDDDEVGADRLPDCVWEVNGIDFLLASAAYIALPEAFLPLERSADLRVMDDIEARVTDALQSCVDAASYEIARPDSLTVAACKVYALLDAKRRLPPKRGACH